MNTSNNSGILHNRPLWNPLHLAEGYRNGDQCCLWAHVALERTFLFIIRFIVSKW